MVLLTLSNKEKKKERLRFLGFGFFRCLVSEASLLCLTSIFCSEREERATVSVFPLPIIPALLCSWHLLIESEGGKKYPFLFLCTHQVLCFSRINQEVSHHLCTMEVLNLHMGCRKGLFDQKFRLCADADFFFLTQLSDTCQLSTTGRKQKPLQIWYYSITCRKVVLTLIMMWWSPDTCRVLRSREDDSDFH